MPKLSISEWTGDYLDEYNRRMLTGHISTTRLSSCSERNGKNDNSVRRMLTEELNRDRRSISYVTDKRLTHRRTNTNDILHVSVFRWEGIYYSTVYVAEMENIDV